MHSSVTTPEVVRKHALQLFSSIGVSRIIVVDDEYASRLPGVEELIGICSELAPSQAAELPHFAGIDFGVDRGIWTDLVRETWEKLGGTQRRELLTQALKAEREVLPAEANGILNDTHKHVDSKAAESLEKILSELEACEYITLSLNEWKAKAQTLLTDAKSANTVLLFDRDFGREEEGTEDEGFNLIRRGQCADVGYCGMITHTVPVRGEYDAWVKLASEYNLERDKFVVIAKERLTNDTPDYYGFLAMLRLVALSKRYTQVKSAAWRIFEKSVAAARATVEDLSVFDFDRIVFESSRREGVWEPDTLFRVFGILMRREALVQLHQDEQISTTFAEARRVSTTEQEIATALDNDCASLEALRIHRFESYESDEQINRFHAPVELGDIFENCSNGKRYLLLVQPCDLVVRKNGKRSYDTHGRTGCLVELVVGPNNEKTKDSWAELPYYDQNTGRPAFANFAKVHHFLLNVLDLCSFREDGVACIEVGMACPELLIDPWKKRFKRLQNFYRAVLTQYEQLTKEGLGHEVQLLALPTPSGTVALPGTVSGRTVRYGLKRVLRLRQPRSGALLTTFTQYQARAAFEHPFDHRVPTHSKGNGSREKGQDEGPE